MNKSLPVAVACTLLLATSLATADDIGIRAPEGFEVTLYADDDLAHDIYSMTFDAQGRVVVSGQGYVKILHDTDDDGRADKATLFSEFPKSGAHGMVFLGNDLIATGDNLLMRLNDKDGDGVADGKPIPLANVKSPEHGANGLVQGPDGWIYMIGGNDAGLGAQFARTKTSPVAKPQAGAVVRFSPDFKTSEIFAHGFRNPYDLAFNAQGHLFTVDADGERDQYLPWYTPTRLFDIQQGMHHGWVQRGWTRSWSRPESFFDNVERLVEIGRGSPTGVECYRHYAFPSHYRGGIYSCCWTLGTVYHFPLTPDGASYKSKKEIFLQTTGDVGFAPVDLAVGPDGDMFVAIGGRGTRGSVFRVRYVGELKEKEKAPEAKDDLDKVLSAPQPLAAWSRAKWLPLAKGVSSADLERASMSKFLSVNECQRAIEISVELDKPMSWRHLHGLAMRDNLALLGLRLGRDNLPTELSARAVWAMGRSKNRSEFSGTLFKVTQLDDLLLKRAAWESLAGADYGNDMATYGVFDTVLFAPRRVQSACLMALQGVDMKVAPWRADDWKTARTFGVLHQRGIIGDIPPNSMPELVSMFDLERTITPVDTIILDLRNDWKARHSVPVKRNAVRMMQICLGDIRTAPTEPDIYAGYSANAAGDVPEKDRRQVARMFAKAFPTEDHATNLEIARLMGMLEVAGKDIDQFAEKITGCWNLASSVQDDIHFLIVLSRLPGQRSEAMTEKTASTLAFLHYKMLFDDMYPSRNWPLRVGETFVELCKRDPQLADVLATHRDFGLPAQAMFAKLMPEKPRKKAARRLLKRARQIGEDAQWTPEMVELIAESNDEESLSAIRGQWENYALRDAIVAVLSKKPLPEDRQLFVDALDETNRVTVARAADALTRGGKPGSVEEIAVALTALRRLGLDKDAAETRKAIGESLKVLTEQDFTFKDGDALAAYQPAFDWFAKTHPEAVAAMNKTAALDGVDWDQRLTNIEWTKGEAASGAKIYEKRACAKCHSGRNRLGPGLEGVTGRWSREDLIKEIVDPNRNVAPQFLTSRLETANGKVYQGIPIYQSPDGTLLQTGPNETVRIAGAEVVGVTRSRTSLMPTGLLQGLGDDEIADLYAYLRTLTAAP